MLAVAWSQYSNMYGKRFISMIETVFVPRVLRGTGKTMVETVYGVSHTISDSVVN